MRWAKSYSIIDHQLLHGGYFHRLGHESLVLYLFLVVVSDREGKSFYSDAMIMNILHFRYDDIIVSRSHLEQEGLIDYQRPYWYVKNISVRKEKKKIQAFEPIPENCVEAQNSDREYGLQYIKKIRKMLSEKYSM